MKKGQRCILTGKLINGKDVVLASEIINLLEKQGSVIITRKNEKTIVNTNNYVADGISSTCTL